MFLKPLMLPRGIVSYLPGMYKLSLGWTGGSDSARYCYSVWLRHLLYARKHGLRKVPEKLGEIGPGDSLGVGLAALLCGVKEYYAFDVVAYANVDKNLKILGELVDLFKAREGIPDGKEFPLLKPDLDSYAFPGDILPEEHLSAALEPGRLERIREAVRHVGGAKGEVKIGYSPGWYDKSSISPASLDMIMSQAVMEHVDDLENAYGAMYRWLKPDGVMTHEVDFKCHGLAPKWNGHWAYSNLIWKILRGKLPYLINREPLSTHTGLIRKCGFNVTYSSRSISLDSIKRSSLADRFCRMTDEDLVTCDAFIIAKKPG